MAPACGRALQANTGANEMHDTPNQEKSQDD
jgi:hypothetical protein